MTVQIQVQRLIDLGVPDLAGVSAELLLKAGDDLLDRAGTTLVVHPSFVPASALASLLSHAGKPGFVVSDMTDVDEFVPAKDVHVPESPLYLVTDIDRGDDMRNWSPEEALAEIESRGRTPLTISEGISWLLQQPERLEPNFCFMCIASRKPKRTGFDARTPAIWISGGTGHDGPGRRGAPKVGWCWWRNRHTWLGVASAARRDPPDGPVSQPSVSAARSST
jgi:hypothetical protein